MEILKKTGDFLKVAIGIALAGYIVFAAGVFPGTIRAHNDLKGLFDKAMNLVDYHQARHKYYLDGLIARGLVDVCENKETGTTDVYFKEECKQDLK